MFIAYFVHTTSVAVFIALYMLAYAGMSFFNIMCWAMIIDVIDDIEVKKTFVVMEPFTLYILSQEN